MHFQPTALKTNVHPTHQQSPQDSYVNKSFQKWFLLSDQMHNYDEIMNQICTMFIFFLQKRNHARKLEIVSNHFYSIGMNK